MLTLGEAFEPGSDNEHFCKPTDIAVGSNGDFYVADGYCNSRVMKFNKDGKFLAKFGEEGETFAGEYSSRKWTILECVS